MQRYHSKFEISNSVLDGRENLESTPLHFLKDRSKLHQGNLLEVTIRLVTADNIASSEFQNTKNMQRYHSKFEISNSVLDGRENLQSTPLHFLKDPSKLHQGNLLEVTIRLVTADNIVPNKLEKTQNIQTYHFK